MCVFFFVKFIIKSQAGSPLIASRTSMKSLNAFMKLVWSRRLEKEFIWDSLILYFFRTALFFLPGRLWGYRKTSQRPTSLYIPVRRAYASDGMVRGCWHAGAHGAWSGGDVDRKAIKSEKNLCLVQVCCGRASLVWMRRPPLVEFSAFLSAKVKKSKKFYVD